jgi:hypothetical protein
MNGLLKDSDILQNLAVASLFDFYLGGFLLLVVKSNQQVDESAS